MPDGRILIIDDEEDIRESLETLLSLEGYHVTLAVNAMQGLEKLASSTYDLVLLDLMMPDKSGMEVLGEVRERDKETPIFLITAYGSIDVAVKALKRGANDYFSKPWDNEKLLIEIERQIAKGRLERENVELKRALKQRYAFPNIVGKSERMLRVLDTVAQVAPSRATVLITGETGTGKELIAKAIHTNSPRADGPFVAVNSGSLQPDLLESTLFGHVKGAFTGAIATRKGAFETANHGTIFFDEIGNVPPDIQAKLLRVIQEREFTPLGSNDVVQVDVRIVAATNEDLRKLVEEKRFREDLYYRLNVIQVSLPPLRERKEDIPLLAAHFFERYGKENGKAGLHFDAEALELVLEHNWPGNVRELENTVERAVVLATADSVPATVLPDTALHPSGVRVRRDAAGLLTSDANLYELVADFERQTILNVLDQVSYSQTEAALRLSIPLSTLNQKIKRLNIEIKKRGA
ncbi:MAG: sigma-54-dependent Fis family transcriptional regulator [Acidobacteria bacterium]|nr:sigma-54-dependent Fis family transcriptional regulator [Acidobacteriota bacterium]